MALILSGSLMGLLVSASYAGSEQYASFDREGYTINVGWIQKNNILQVKGKVEDGKVCSQLNIDIFFDNSKESHISRVAASIKNYKPSRKRRFKASDTVRTSIHDRRGWHVSSIYINCLD